MNALLRVQASELLVTTQAREDECSLLHAPELLERVATEDCANKRAVGLERLEDLRHRRCS